MIPPNPITRFREVYALANEIDRSIVPDPSAMSLATVEEGGQPAVRIVLLKAFDESGFVFYTNHGGRKGRHLVAHPHAALCFYWPPLGIQVRIEGDVARVGDLEADAYFATRPRTSQLGAWASKQSEPMESPDALTDRLAEFERKFAGGDVRRPDFWSGFRVRPARIEFWKERANRLHERHLYTRDGPGWRVEVLYP